MTRETETENFEDDQGKDRLLAVKLRCNEKVEKTNFVLISSLNESYPGGCLGAWVTHSVRKLPFQLSVGKQPDTSVLK